MTLTQRHSFNSITVDFFCSRFTSEGLALRSPSYNGFSFEIGDVDFPGVAQVSALFDRQNAPFPLSRTPAPRVV